MRKLRAAAVDLCIASLCLAQTPAVSDDPPLFEVASIKPTIGVAQGMSLTRTPGGGLSNQNAPLRMLITFAYDIRDHQLTGAPAWIDTERYDIEAKVTADAARMGPAGFDPAASSRFRLRVRGLLSERFKLAVHHETKELPIYALVVARNGPKLEPWKEADGPGPQIRGQPGALICAKVKLKMFAEAILAQRLGNSVVDKTGLSGDFTFKIEYDDGQPKTAGDSMAPPKPVFLDAMQEQLGLKLESQKGPVDILVIDHVEKASAN